MSQFIITGAPRAGTKYVARVLTECGIECMHEELFGIDQVEFDMPQVMKKGGVLNEWGPADGPPVCGESSWMAVPFLPMLGKKISIFHQMRNPVDSARSMYAVGLFREDRQKGKRYTKFIEKHTINTFQYKSEIDKCFAFWLEWNKRVTDFGTSKYNIEMFNEYFITIIGRISGRNVDPEKVKGILSDVEKTINQSKWQQDARKKAVEKIDMGSITNQKLKREVQEYAKYNGYDI